jgi:cobalamin biosynthesis Mg chelatase CobN
VTSQTPEELEAEVEQKREQLAGTLDALSAKLDVKTQAQAKVAEVKGQVKDRATTETGRPRTEVLLVGATVLVVTVALVWWRKR